MADIIYNPANFREADWIRAMKWLVKDGDKDEPVIIPRAAFNRMCDLSIKHLEIKPTATINPPSKDSS